MVVYIGCRGRGTPWLRTVGGRNSNVVVVGFGWRGFVLGDITGGSAMKT